MTGKSALGWGSVFAILVGCTGSVMDVETGNGAHVPPGQDAGNGGPPWSADGGAVPQVDSGTDPNPDPNPDPDAGTTPDPDPDPTPTGFPSAANTGWQHTGVALTNSGSITVTKDGTVLDSLNINGCVTVNAKNVVIKRSKITTNGDCYGGIKVTSSGANLLIEDVEIDGSGSLLEDDDPLHSLDDCIAFSGYTARRVNLHGCSDGAKIGTNVVIEASYIHDLRNDKTCHCDGTQSTGSTNVTLRGNNIDVKGSGAAIMLGDEFGSLIDITIEGNRLNGGNNSLYGGYPLSYSSHQLTNLRVLGNVFGADHTYATHIFVRPNTEWTGNTFEPTGETVKVDEPLD